MQAVICGGPPVNAVFGPLANTCHGLRGCGPEEEESKKVLDGMQAGPAA